MEEKKLPYSYHTFFYPFLLKNGLTRKTFCEGLHSGQFHWREDNMILNGGKQLTAAVSPGADNVTLRDIQKARWNYQTFQYFNPAAREALFEEDGGIVSSYRLRDAKGGTYEILHSGKRYILEINAIRLKVFNTGVAVMVFELEYPMPQAGAAQARKDVKLINEYGRRLYPEFLTEKEDGFLLCADAIAINLAGGKSVVSDLRGRAIVRFPTKKDDYKNDYLNDPIQLPEVISEIVGVEQDNIEPAIDDRMFVCCCILDSAYANSFLGYPAWPENSERRQNHDWKFLTDWETGCELYAVTNIDAGSSTCQNRVMLNQYFEEQLYLRWIECGTIHAVTNHSMVCITSPAVMDEVVNPFLIEYIPMCILVQVQRASLLAFDDKITETIRSAQGKPGTIEGDMLSELIELEEDFAVFQGQLLLQEITPQIQGIELYERLQKMLFVEKLETGVQRQLNNLYEIAESKLAKQQENERIAKAEKEKQEEAKRQEEKEAEQKKAQKMEHLLSALAILGIISAWADLTAYAENFFKPSVQVAGICGVLVALIAALIAYFIFRKPRKKD